MPGTILIVGLVGEFDMAREHELLDLVMTLSPTDGTAVDADMSEVTFVDSAGLHGVVTAKTYLDRHGCELRLLRPRHQRLRLIDLTGFDEILTVVRAVDDVERDERLVAVAPDFAVRVNVAV